MIPALIVLGLLIVFIGPLVAMYNGLVRKRVASESAWADIDVQLKRRHNLIPNLVETVKGYAAHEKQTLENVVQARSAAVDAGSVADQAQAESFLTATLGKLFALAEAYPDLKADQNFQQLQGELATTENMISSARNAYNGAVRVYNTACQSFPSNIIAGIFKFEEREFFEAEDAEVRAVPKVSF